MKTTIKAILFFASFSTMPAIMASQGPVQANTELRSITNPWLLRKAWRAQENAAAANKIYKPDDFKSFLDHVQSAAIEQYAAGLTADLESQNQNQLNTLFEATTKLYLDAQRKTTIEKDMKGLPSIIDADNWLLALRTIQKAKKSKETMIATIAHVMSRLEFAIIHSQAIEDFDRDFKKLKNTQKQEKVDLPSENKSSDSEGYRILLENIHKQEQSNFIREQIRLQKENLKTPLSVSSTHLLACLQDEEII